MGGRHCAQSLLCYTIWYVRGPANHQWRCCCALNVVACEECKCSGAFWRWQHRRSDSSCVLDVGVFASGVVKGKKVLALGCGMVVLVITLACLGAEVTLTDTKDIIPHTERNVNHNAQLIQSGNGAAAVATLNWECLGWPQPVLVKRYDMIVGADLIYAAKDIGPLSSTLQQIRQNSPDCALMLAHKSRSPATTGQLIKTLRQNGISLSQVCTCGAISIFQSLLS